LPSCQFSQERLIANICEKKYLEIGFGMGEHFIHQAKHNHSSLYIGAEVFINGITSALRQLQNNKLTNCLIWPDDVDLLTSQIPAKSLNGIYILFPDPWPKRRYLKKRLLNSARLTTLKDKLKDGGFISFASDIEDYFLYAKELFSQDADFTIQDKDPSLPHEGYIITKYHQKAIKEGRSPQFITVFLRS
jgi:release factor glutamine methyltransferase